MAGAFLKGVLHVKRMFAVLLSCALLLGMLPGCQGDAPSPSGPVVQDGDVPVLSAVDLISTAFDYCGRRDEDGLEGLYAKESRELLETYARNAYQLEDAWEDMAVIRGKGASSFELAVVQMADDAAAVRAAAAFKDYISLRQGDFTGYAPAEADMAANGEVLQRGPYAVLFICPDPKGAGAAVGKLLDGEIVLPPELEPSAQPAVDVKALRDLVVSSQEMPGAKLKLLDDGDSDKLNAYVTDAYGLAPERWEECAIARDEATAFEVAVMRVPGEGTVVWEIKDYLTDYLNRREAQFNPVSIQARLLHEAIVGEAADGTQYYVLLLACKDRAGAMAACSEAVGAMGLSFSFQYRYSEADPDYPDRCLFTPPNRVDMSLYDTSAIRAAWELGDPSGLSEYDREIYDGAEKVLGEVLEDGMSGYEKERAVYGWMIDNVGYDWTLEDWMEETTRESFTPHGGLVERKAVCLGFAATFQLLMDLAGVECVTVVGASHNSRSDHAWNMVRLDGEWYCLDVTWDVGENSGRSQPEDWIYFNVTSDFMADSGHQWDYANTPEATAEGRGRG